MDTIFVQIASENSGIPSEHELQMWCNAALIEEHKAHEVVVRIVDEDEIQSLNSTFRQKDKTTNVLSFPSEVPKELGLNVLGDIIICAAVVESEAKTQQKTSNAHWAHMVVHGTLHLQGYDHIEDHEAEKMESLETDILIKLGFSAPYQSTDI